MKNQDNIVRWELWYTSANDKAMDFIKNFKDSEVELLTSSNDKVKFEPKIVTWACPTCDADFKRKECVSNGKYCAMNHKGSFI
jgi:predicted RNA-binding Zn-ribbon protein involved in translation (DUF1610 family)